MKKQFLVIMVLFCVSCMVASAQEMMMSGKIIESENGGGIASATLQVKRTGQVITTDENGYFSWTPKNVQSTDSVSISCVGFFTIGRVVKELKNATLMLSPQNYVLKEVSFSRKKPLSKMINSIKIRKYGERDRIPDLGGRQTDMIGRPFLGENSSKFPRIRSVQVLQEGFQTKDLSAWRSQQHWRFRLRIVEADADGLPTDKDLLKQRVILTVSDADYQYYDPGRYDERTNSTKYTNWDYSERVLFGIFQIDLRRYDVSYPPNGVYVFVELLPPLIVGGDRIFRLALYNVGNIGWFRNGRSKQWSRGVHWVVQPDGKEIDQNIEPAIALEIME
jgi:hypothetical protein